MLNWCFWSRHKRAEGSAVAAEVFDSGRSSSSMPESAHEIAEFVEIEKSSRNVAMPHGSENHRTHLGIH